MQETLERKDSGHKQLSHWRRNQQRHISLSRAGQTGRRAFCPGQGNAELREQYTECRVRLASLEKQRERFEDEAARTKRERRRLEEKRQHKAAEMSLAQTKQQQLSTEAAARKREAVGLQSKRHQLITVLAKREADLKRMATELREQAEQLRQLEKSFTGLERKQARLEVEQERVEGDLQAILDRLRDSWELEFPRRKNRSPVQNRQQCRRPFYK